MLARLREILVGISCASVEDESTGILQQSTSVQAMSIFEKLCSEVLSTLVCMTYNRSMSHFVSINYPVPPLHFQQHVRTASNLTHNKAKS